MATQVKTRPDLHAEDLYARSRAQAELLRSGRFAEPDLAHLIEEIEGVGGAMQRAVRKRIRTILKHLLKLEHSPAKEPRAGWRATVRTQRGQPARRVDARLAARSKVRSPSSTTMRVALPTG